ncbi:hypothetical protein DPMN_153661 [Dreissena polymorpha]|uniref:Uncharacterized protein n=1 Tax=Dreissena polymorpha TaxID=45954 RepID=A0A9D4FNJ4_DREPO|nr:hypothetical protein DPMN_153661 [Dreissena polymorpha]
MDGRHALVLAHQNLKEQVELLEILLVELLEILLVYILVLLLDKFKRQGFGRRQNFKHVLEEPMDRLVKRIGFLEVLVLLQALDLETVERLACSKRAEEHSLLKDQHMFQAIDKAVQGGQLTKKYGNLALQLNVFDFILDMLSQEPFCGKSNSCALNHRKTENFHMRGSTVPHILQMTASLSHCVIYTVLLAALTAFEETTLTCSHMEMQAAVRFLIAQLPVTTLVKLSTALASANSSSASKHQEEKPLELWSELPCYKKYLDRNSSQDIRPEQDDLIWQLARDKTPYSAGHGPSKECSYCGDAMDTISIRPWQLVSLLLQLKTTGRKGELEVPYNGWELLKGEIQELLYQIAKGAVQLRFTFLALLSTTCSW